MVEYRKATTPPDEVIKCHCMICGKILEMREEEFQSTAHIRCDRCNGKVSDDDL